MPARDERHILVGDLNVAPHENDVLVAQAASEGGLPHSDRMREASGCPGAWRVARRSARMRIPFSEKVYNLVELPAPPTGRSETAAAGSITSVVACAEGCGQRFPDPSRRAWLGAGPSDHVPVYGDIRGVNSCVLRRATRLAIF